MTLPDQPPFPWYVGEHVAAIGDTGTGKTYLLAKYLLRYRQYVVVFKTKPDPDDDDKWQGFKRTDRARLMNDERYTRILIEPKYSRQAVEGFNMLEMAWRMGRWTVCIDELWYAERLGLTEFIERLLTQGRSKGISVVIGQQRPVTTSRFAISQTTHLFSFRVEGRDAKTIGESSTPRILPYISEEYAERAKRRDLLVTGHEFAYYHRARRYVGKGTARRLGDLVVPPGELAKSSRKPLDTGTPAPEARAI